MEKGIELVEYFYSLITEDVLRHPFQKQKLKSKFKSLKIIYKKFPSILEVIDQILTDFFPETPVIDLNEDLTIENTEDDQVIYLTAYFGDKEIQTINQVFGFSPTNKELSAARLERGYSANQSTAANKWYEFLKFYFFTDHSHLSSDELIKCYRKKDELFRSVVFDGNN